MNLITNRNMGKPKTIPNRVGTKTFNPFLIMARTFMASITANYGPQDGQEHRSSSNIGDWNAPEGKNIYVEVSPNGSLPQPTFSIWHDKSWATDTQWWTGLENGESFNPAGQNGDPGKRDDLYIVTTNAHGIDPGSTYEVKFYIEE